jgi:hypothetical protein
MPVVSDFIEIVGDGAVTIGDGLPVWEANFNTGGRRSDATAFLIFNVRGLTYASSNVEVKVNNQSIGYLHRYGGLSDADRNETAKHWYTQMISLAGTTLNDGNNEIQIAAVKYSGATATDTFDDFSLKNVFCFFHQEA